MTTHAAASATTLDCACTCTLERQGRTGNPACPCWIHCACFDDHPSGPTDAEIDRAMARMDHLFGPGWVEDKTFNAEVAAISALVTAMRPLLAGHSPGVQSGALADCLALWLAGHHVAGDEAATRTLRADLLAKHCSLVSDLVPLNAKQLGTQE